jgi:hypothetical protein
VVGDTFQVRHGTDLVRVRSIPVWECTDLVRGDTFQVRHGTNRVRARSIPVRECTDLVRTKTIPVCAYNDLVRVLDGSLRGCNKPSSVSDISSSAHPTATSGLPPAEPLPVLARIRFNRIHALPLPGLGRGVANDVGQRVWPVPFQPATAKYTLAAPKSDKGGKHAKIVLTQKNAKGAKICFSFSAFQFSEFQRLAADIPATKPAPSSSDAASRPGMTENKICDC